MNPSLVDATTSHLLPSSSHRQQIAGTPNRGRLPLNCRRLTPMLPSPATPPAVADAQSPATLSLAFNPPPPPHPYRSLVPTPPPPPHPLWPQ